MSGQPDESKRLRITRVYTGFGDKGMTSLAGGQTVSKNDAYMHVFGTLDELQVAIGAMRDHFAAALTTAPAPLPALYESYSAHLAYIQHRLFTLTGRMATTVQDRRAGMPATTKDDIAYLETLIDAINDPLPPLRDFVLPGGDTLTTAMHVCRVICRRAEREVVNLAMRTYVDDVAMVYVNRLSDLFFVMARRINHEQKQAGLVPGHEIIWERDPVQPPMPA